MKIVVLDAYTINPGDLSWKELESLGDCSIYDRTAEQDIIARAENADILLTNKTVLDAATIKELSQVKYIGVMATGFNVVDVAAARVKNIIVTNVPAYGTASVAQATFALLLELTNHVGYYNQTVHEGQWSKSVDFCYADRPLTELAGLTMGIIGFGTIGRAVAQLAQAFGMKTIVYSRTKKHVSNLHDVKYCELDELFSQADVITLHCAFALETMQLINSRRLKQMKKTALLINTGRGQLINEDDLAQALKEGTIAGAGLDVLSVEPPRNGNVLLQCPNCIITPHIAWASKSARKRLLDTSINNLQAYLSGRAMHVVS